MGLSTDTIRLFKLRRAYSKLSEQVLDGYTNLKPALTFTRNLLKDCEFKHDMKADRFLRQCNFE